MHEAQAVHVWAAWLATLRAGYFEVELHVGDGTVKTRVAHIPSKAGPRDRLRVSPEDSQCLSLAVIGRWAVLAAEVPTE
jgi:hypothetical protein